MKKLILTGILALATGLSSLSAQQPAAQPAGAAAQKGPSPKSPAEGQAIQALMQAGQSNDPAAIIKAADELVSKFADTDYKEWAYSLEARAYQMNRDDIKAEIFATRALEINPKAYQMTLLLGEVVTNHIGEHDLDRDQKVTRATKAFNDTIENVKIADKPNAALPDDQWAEFKKGEIAEATNGLGMIALLNKKYDDAATFFKAASEGDPQPAYLTRLASAYQSGGKYDQAIVICDKLLADPQLHPQIKAAVTGIKKLALDAKGKN